MTPTFLLENPDVVTPQSPWCVTVDNLELGVLLLTQPWLARGGLRRADLERQLTHLAADLPIGPIYFQRVKRAVARLVAIGTVRAIARGRSVRFAITPEGFATLILNLRVLRTDPTLDGSEFELKRALVTMWSLVLDRLAELPDRSDGTSTSPETERFFRTVEAVVVFGQQVITEAAVEEAFDVLRLIAGQRQRVESSLIAARGARLGAEATAEPVRALDLASSFDPLAGNPPAPRIDAPETIAMVRSMASKLLPRLSLQAKVLRYEQYLIYLDNLSAMYAHELHTAAVTTMRQVLRQGWD